MEKLKEITTYMRRLDILTDLYRWVAGIYNLDKRGLEKVISKIFNFRIKELSITYQLDYIIFSFYTNEDKERFYNKYRDKLNLVFLKTYGEVYDLKIITENLQDKKIIDNTLFFLKNIVEKVVDFINKTLSGSPFEYLSQRNPLLLKLLVIAQLKSDKNKKRGEHIKIDDIIIEGIRDIVNKLNEYKDLYFNNISIIYDLLLESIEKIENLLKSKENSKEVLGKILSDIFNFPIKKAVIYYKGFKPELIFYLNEYKEFKDKYKNRFLLYSNPFHKKRISLKITFSHNLFHSEKAYYTYDLFQKILNALSV